MQLHEKTITYMESFTAITESLFHFLQVKLAMGSLVGIYSFFFFPEHLPLMGALLGLIFFDFITGIIAAYKEGLPIRSRWMVRTPIKIAMYGVLISAAHMTELTVFGVESQFSILEKMMIGFLAATEMISVLENAGRMGYAVPKKLLNQLEYFTGKHEKEHRIG